jgi:serine/threonine-protein kinase
MKTSFRPGEVIARRYQLEALLGEGGMGAVWRAHDLNLGSTVAVKLLSSEYAGDAPARARFEREARAAAALRSAHVVQILEYGIHEEQFPYIAMELLEGETLADRIEYSKGRPLTHEDVCRIMTHVARAVGRAHELGIVHRDLKPENIFLVRNDEEEIAKVLDFGIAKLSDGPREGTKSSHTRTGALLGTPNYMSPEQAHGNKTIDFRSDLWSMAMIAFECVCGQTPFTSPALGELVLMICTGPIPKPSERCSVPAAFDAWFAKAATREPEGRFQSARELANTLRAALLGEESNEQSGLHRSLADAGGGARRAVSGIAPTIEARTAAPFNVTTGRGALVAPSRPSPPARTGLRVTVAVFALAAVAGVVWFAAQRARNAAVEPELLASGAEPAAVSAAPTPQPPAASAAPPAPAASTSPATSSAPSASVHAAPRAPAPRVRPKPHKRVTKDSDDLGI